MKYYLRITLGAFLVFGWIALEFGPLAAKSAAQGNAAENGVMAQRGGGGQGRRGRGQGTTADAAAAAAQAGEAAAAQAAQGGGGNQGGRRNRGNNGGNNTGGGATDATGQGQGGPFGGRTFQRGRGRGGDTTGEAGTAGGPGAGGDQSNNPRGGPGGPGGRGARGGGLFGMAAAGDPEEQVKQLMTQMDKNGNGMIDADELQADRRMAGFIGRADSDKNGVITQDELRTMLANPTVTFSGPGGGRGGPQAERAVSTETPAANNPNPEQSNDERGGRGRGRGGRGGPGGPDRDGDGIPDNQENGSRGGPEGGRGGRGPQRNEKEKDSDGQVAKTFTNTALASYRPKPGKEQSPKEGLPAWFTSKDVNSDGQVSMSEYTTKWTDPLVREFSQYDLDGDGFITAKEAKGK